jgi:hypothetical protein
MMAATTMTTTKMMATTTKKLMTLTKMMATTTTKIMVTMTTTKMRATTLHIWSRALMWRGPMPQQPPTMLRPDLSIHSVAFSTRVSAGSSPQSHESRSH